MKKYILVSLGMTSFMFVMGGCATIVSGKTQVIDVTSKITKTFSIDGLEYKTPAKVHLHRSKDDKVISVNGCKDIPLKSEMNPVVIGNVLVGGLLGSTTDFAGGAGWKYDDNITLDCK